MIVSQVFDGLKPLANHIYILPPDKLMEIEKGLLHLILLRKHGTDELIRARVLAPYQFTGPIMAQASA